MNTPVIEMKGIEKNFPGVKALDEVDFTLYPHEILGLVGENGAGKSTLMRILVGLYRPDGGTFKLRGKIADHHDPLQAIQQGIGMVFQEGCLIPNMTVAENIFLCHEHTFSHFGLINMKKLRTEAIKQLRQLHVEVDPDAYVRDISPACRQMVEIVRLLWLSQLSGVDNPVLILDEPTTVLLEDEIDRLFKALETVRTKASIIFISHRLEEILRVSDRIVVLKDGRNSAEFAKGAVTEREIEACMVGHEMSIEHFRENEQTESRPKVVLEIRGLHKEGHFDAMDVTLHEGEILSFVGVIGAGKEELCRCIAGIDRPTSGTIFLDGKELRSRSVKDSIKAGIGYIPIDRRQEGLALQMDVAMNVNFLILRKMVKWGFIPPHKERDSANHWITQCKIKTPNMKVHCSKLSGGNQQKVVIAKWLASNIRVLILDHPTRGIDVGAKDEIYHRIRTLAEKGLAIIIMSDRLEEDIGLCNRMIMMKDGKITQVMDCKPGEKPSPLEVIRYIV